MTDRTRLAPLTTMRVGGAARRLVEATTTAELLASVRDCDARSEPVLLVAGGSNLVVADDGFPGTCVLVRSRGIEVEIDEDTETALVTAQAGESWDRLVAMLVADGMAGVEALSGIPGAVGATPFQNVGAYGAEVSQVIESVEVFDRLAGQRRVFANEECGFGYRSSRFKSEPDRWLVLAVTYRLRVGDDSTPIRYQELASALEVAVGDTASLARVRRTVLDIRRRKGMVVDIDDHDSWSCGSFFTNPIVDASTADGLPDDAPRWTMPDGRSKVSAAWLIGQAGFDKGYALPGSAAAISTKHTLAITNRGGATAEQVVTLARTIQDAVLARFGIALTPEPRLIFH